MKEGEVIQTYPGCPCGDIKLLKERQDLFQIAYAEQQQLVNAQLREMHDDVKTMKAILQNGLGSKLDSIKQQVDFQWWIIGFGIMGILGGAGAIIVQFIKP